MRVYFPDETVVEYVDAVRCELDQESQTVLIDDAMGNRIAEVPKGDVVRWEAVA